MEDRYDDEVAREERRSGRGCLAGVFVLLVLAALYAGGALYFGDRVPADTTVGGVRIGGMTDDEARAALERELEDEEARELTVEGGGQSFTVDPAGSGLAYDYEGSLAGLTGFSLNPVDLVNHVRGGVDRPVEVAVDEDALGASVDAGAKKLERKPVEGSVRLSGSQVKVKESKEGLAVDREAIVDAVESGWPEQLTYTAPTSAVEPKLAQAEITRFVDEDLEPLVSGPVTVRSTDPKAKGDDKEISFPVTAEALAAAVSVSQDKGKLSVKIDDKKLAKAVVDAGTSSGELREAQDAGVVFKGAKDFEVTPAKSGLGLKGDSIVKPVREAMTKEGDARTAEVDSESTKPDFTTAEAKKTLPKERISHFTSALPDNPTRTHNIKIAAKALDGTYVAPGDTFSLNEHLGQRTAAKGYNKAGVIMNGRLREDYGGGISQLSTTLFNAIFFSGAKIEEYHPHSFYISRYPEGREATISWPDVDNRFTNDTGAGILIQASASSSEVTISFYGRKKWDVEAQKGPRRNVVQPKSITDDSTGCVPQSPNVGFDVTVTRIFKQGGREVRRSDFTTHYIPSDQVTCTNP